MPVKKLSVQTLVSLILVAFSLSLFAYIIHEVLYEKESQFDEYVFNSIPINFNRDWVYIILDEVTWFASSTFLQIAYGILIIVYLIQKRFRRVGEIILIGLGGHLINFFLKQFFQRVRPHEPLGEVLNNYSFPSGHAMSGIIFYGLLAYLIGLSNLAPVLKYLIAFLLLLFSLVIGFSRIFLRYHYASDVVAGFCLGISWLVIVLWMLSAKKNNEHQSQNA